MSNQPLVVITGGRGDLAQAVAVEFDKAAYRVECPGREELDVSCAKTVAEYFASRETLAVLVNNAGITADSVFARLSSDRWDAVVDTNLKGVHLCSQAAARCMMRQQDGHIINIGSYSALHPTVGQCAYAASKAGLIGLTKSYAREFGTRNIRVNCVLPGFLETRMTASLSGATRAAALKRHTLKRFNTPAEAARFIHYLATSDHISGQVFQLDSRT